MTVQQNSLLAYAEAQKGINESQKNVYRALLRIGRPATMRQLSKIMEIPINRITPRVGELRLIQWVVESFNAPDPDTGRMSCFYEAVPGKDISFQDMRETFKKKLDPGVEALPCPIDSRIPTMEDILR
jgi:predicted transcriptional regulator